MSNVLLEEVKAKLVAEGIGKNVKLGGDGLISFGVDKYEVNVWRANKQSLFFFDQTKKTEEERRMYFTVLQFMKTGEKKPCEVFYLVNCDDSSQIVDWIKEKVNNPTEDRELFFKVKEIRQKVDELQLDFLMKGKNTAISGEFEELGECRQRQRAVLLMYNDILTEDYMLFQAKRILDQPGEPILFNVRTINATDINIEDKEFDINDVAGIVKKQIALKCMDLSEKVKEGSRDFTEIERRLAL